MFFAVCNEMFLAAQVRHAAKGVAANLREWGTVNKKAQASRLRQRSSNQLYENTNNEIQYQFDNNALFQTI